MDWLNTVAGFGVGIVVGLTGVGGGALMTPILVLLFGVAPATAVGTDLWFAALTKMFGGAMHHRRGTVDWEVFRRLLSGSLPAAIFTMLWMHYGGIQKHDGIIVTAAGVVLILTGLTMLLKNRILAIGTQSRISSAITFKRMQPLLTVLAGALLGVLVSLTSIGAGALGTVALVYLYPLRMVPPRLIGTDIMHAIPLALAAGFGHLLMGNVDFPLLAALLLGSVPGIVLGSMGSAKAPEGVLRVLISIVLGLVGIRMIA